MKKSHPQYQAPNITNPVAADAEVASAADEVEELAFFGLQTGTIALLVGCSPSQLTSQFADALAHGRARQQQYLLERLVGQIDGAPPSAPSQPAGAEKVTRSGAPAPAPWQAARRRVTMRSPEVIAERQRQMRDSAGARRRGRPQLPLDPIEVFELAEMGLSNRRIAAHLGCHPKTLRRFAPDLERARLRRRPVAAGADAADRRGK